MKTLFVNEPDLEFGGGGRHIDIRFGIMEHGPLDRARGTAPRRIRVGLVGSADTIAGTLGWPFVCTTVFESLRPVIWRSGLSTTAPATTGPARQPRPTSSTPHTRQNPSLLSTFSNVRVAATRVMFGCVGA